MKGKVAGGHHRQKYVLMGLFHYWWSFLIMDKRWAAVPLLKKINSCSPYGGLHMYIMWKSLFRFPNFSAWSCRVMSSLEPVQQRSARQQLKKQTTAPSTDDSTLLSRWLLTEVQNPFLITGWWLQLMWDIVAVFLSHIKCNTRCRWDSTAGLAAI